MTVANSPFRVEQNVAPRVPQGDNQAPAPIDSSIDKWFFISVCPFFCLLTTGIRPLELVCV
jgi:hypothetical protein